MRKKISRWFRRPKNPEGHVYYARLKTSIGIFYKIGFTSKSTLTERMAFGGFGDEKLIDYELFFTFRDDAWDVEQTLLEHFDKERAFGKYSNDPEKPLCNRGQSELFNRDILGLDEECYKCPDDEVLKRSGEKTEQEREGCLMILIGIVLAPFTLGFSLFFVFGGVSGIVGAGGSQRDLTQPSRPVHPRMIQECIDSLYRGGEGGDVRAKTTRRVGGDI